MEIFKILTDEIAASVTQVFRFAPMVRVHQPTSCVHVNMIPMHARIYRSSIFRTFRSEFHFNCVSVSSHLLQILLPPANEVWSKIIFLHMSNSVPGELASQHASQVILPAIWGGGWTCFLASSQVTWPEGSASRRGEGVCIQGKGVCIQGAGWSAFRGAGLRLRRSGFAYSGVGQTPSLLRWN